MDYPYLTLESIYRRHMYKHISVGRTRRSLRTKTRFNRVSTTMFYRSIEFQFAADQIETRSVRFLYHNQLAPSLEIRA